MEKNQSKIEPGKVVQKIVEKHTTKGEYTFISLERNPTANEMTLLRRYARGDKAARFGLRNLIKAESEVRNIVPTCGRNVFNRLLAGDNTYSGEITHGAFGSGTTAFTNASTQLNAEVFRKAVPDAAVDGNVTYVDWFIDHGDVADQTFEEFGAFIDGTAGANTGQAFSLVITGGWEKSGSMFISLKVTLT